MPKAYTAKKKKSIGKKPQNGLGAVALELADKMRTMLDVPVDSNVVPLPHELIVRFVAVVDKMVKK